MTRSTDEFWHLHDQGGEPQWIACLDATCEMPAIVRCAQTGADWCWNCAFMDDRPAIRGKWLWLSTQEE